MNHLSLFSGIGGFDLAAEWMGWDNVAHCESNEINRKVLQYYWPKAKSYENIKTTDFKFWRGKIDILTGGFPCQPFSHAGRRKGSEDDRHLWPEMLRAIQEIKPSYIVAENVRGLLNWSEGMVFDSLFANLEAEGYEVTAFILPAIGINAPHRRERLFIIAYSKQARLERINQARQENQCKRDREDIWGTAPRCSSESFYRNSSYSKCTGRRQDNWIRKSRLFDQKMSNYNWENFPTESPFCSSNDGLPQQMDGLTFPRWRKASLMAFGNAIVPQIAYKIFKSIFEIDQKLLLKNIIE